MGLEDFVGRFSPDQEVRVFVPGFDPFAKIRLDFLHTAEFVKGYETSGCQSGTGQNGTKTRALYAMTGDCGVARYRSRVGYVGLFWWRYRVFLVQRYHRSLRLMRFSGKSRFDVCRHGHGPIRHDVYDGFGVRCFCALIEA